MHIKRTEHAKILRPQKKLHHLSGMCFSKRSVNHTHSVIATEILKNFTRKPLFGTKRFHRCPLIISDFEEGKTDILIGTQMVSKGLDFDRVSVVGILNADSMLNYPDFRSYERAFQLMAQVAGRAGRKSKRGLVVLQTKQPDLPLIHEVVTNDYQRMFGEQIEERNMFRYPPFFRLIYVYLKHRKQEVLDQAADRMASVLRQGLGERVLGPDLPPVSRIQTLFIKKIIVKVEQQASLSKVRTYLRQVQRMMIEDERFRSLLVYYDVDPM